MDDDRVKSRPSPSFLSMIGHFNWNSSQESSPSRGDDCKTKKEIQSSPKKRDSPELYDSEEELVLKRSSPIEKKAKVSPARENISLEDLISDIHEEKSTPLTKKSTSKVMEAPKVSNPSGWLMKKPTKGTPSVVKSASPTPSKPSPQSEPLAHSKKSSSFIGNPLNYNSDPGNSPKDEDFTKKKTSISDYFTPLKKQTAADKSKKRSSPSAAVNVDEHESADELDLLIGDEQKLKVSKRNKLKKSGSQGLLSDSQNEFDSVYIDQLHGVKSDFNEQEYIPQPEIEDEVPKPKPRTPSDRFSYTAEVLKVPENHKNPSKIIDPDEDSPQPKKILGNFLTGKYIPQEYENVANQKSSFNTLKKLITKKDELVCIGAIYKYNVTNFRVSEKKKSDTPEFVKVAENLLGFSILPSQTKQIYFMPLKETDRDQVPVKERVSLIMEFLENKSVTKICYDCQQTFKTIVEQKPSIRPEKLYDPKVGAWICNPELESYEYIELLNYFLKHVEKDRIESNVNKMAADMLACFRLWNSIHDILNRENLMEVFEQQEMKVALILSKMELNGVGFQYDLLKKGRQKILQRIGELQSEASKILGHPIQLSSPQRVSHALFEELNLGGGKSKGKKESKQHISTGEKVLQGLKKEHPLPGIILEFRHCQKLLSTYIDAFDKKAVSSKTKAELPRIYTSWHQTNTATGRLASVNPNLQNLPRQPLSITLEGKTEPSLLLNFRDAICANKGFRFAAFDYSQIEMRVLAHMSGDEYLLDFFAKGQDIHRLIASRWLGKSPDKISDVERDRAKRIVFGILYGMGPGALSDILDVNLKEASNFIDSFLGKFPSVSTFLEETVSFAKKNGFVKTLLNRRRLLPEIKSHDPKAMRRSERQATNSVIQGTAADIVKMAMIKADDLISFDSRFKNTKLILQIHDELVFEIDEKNLNYVTKRILEVMENVVSLEVALPVKCSVGACWGSLKNFEPKDSPIKNSKQEIESTSKGLEDIPDLEEDTGESPTAVEIDALLAVANED